MADLATCAIFIKLYLPEISLICYVLEILDEFAKLSSAKLISLLIHQTLVLPNFRRLQYTYSGHQIYVVISIFWCIGEGDKRVVTEHLVIRKN